MSPTLAELKDQTLFDHQCNLEKEMKRLSFKRQANEEDKANDRKEGSSTKHGRMYLRRITEIAVPLVQDLMSPSSTPRRGKNASHLLQETGLDAELVAYLTSKVLLDLCIHHGTSLGGPKRSTASAKIGSTIMREAAVDRYRESSPEREVIIQKLEKDFERRGYPSFWREKTIRNYLNASEIEPDFWTNAQKVIVGHALLVVLIEAMPDVFSLDPANKRVSLSYDFVDKMIRSKDNALVLFAIHFPMVIPPKPWSKETLFTGGYYTSEAPRYSLIKRASSRDAERLQNMDWSQVFPAVNAIQETPWRVNQKVLEAVEWSFYDLSTRERFITHGIGKLVSSEDIPIPEKPADYDTDEEVKAEQNLKVFNIRNMNRQNKSPRLSALMAIQSAKKLSKFDRFYYPHSLDSRGRAYPLAAFLNPQGTDYSKAILEFADGKPIGNEEGSNWIAIAGANAYGYDKVPLQERIAWVYENEELILSIAHDYKNDLRWTEADEPFQFLRFCLEWQGFKENGYAHVSHMVVPVDATCSGLQHYAAMLKDDIGGAAVNLIPNPDRQDIYGDVAKRTIEHLEMLWEEGEEQARIADNLIKFGVDRSITKRSVMVVPYAGKFSSCMSYTKEAVQEKILKKGAQPTWNATDIRDYLDHMGALSKCIWQAITDIVVKGKEAMAWLSKLASLYSKYVNDIGVSNPYNRRMSWVTPDGFEVSHFRPVNNRVRVTSYFRGKISLVMMEPSDKLEVKDMSLAVAPNFVHSLDATHLRMTIIKSLPKGISSFAMVHDSFGTHAGDMKEFLQGCVKESFIELYTENDVLQELYEAYREVLGDDLPPPPANGNLDLTA